MSNKDGFTLVEMSFVVVVIGIILALSMKGIILIDTARLRGEVAKFSAITEAYNAYALRYGTPIGQVASDASAYDIDELLDKGFLSRDSRTSRIELGSLYGIRVCNAGEYQYYEELYWVFPTLELPLIMSNACIYVQENDAAGSPMVGMAADIICGVESILDDMNYKTGRGRGARYGPTHALDFCEGYLTAGGVYYRPAYGYGVM